MSEETEAAEEESPASTEVDVESTAESETTEAAA